MYKSAKNSAQDNNDSIIQFYEKVYCFVYSGPFLSKQVIIVSVW